MNTGYQQTNGIMTSLEKNGAANLIAIKDMGSVMNSGVERTANANNVAIERIHTNVSSLVQTNADQVRNLVQNVAREERGLNYQHQIQVLNSFKDSDLRSADSLRWNVESQGRLNLDMYKIKNDLEKHTSDQYNMTTRDILGFRADVMRQNVENTMAIQTDALKNKECLSKQMMDCCCEIKEKITSTDKDRIRDYLAEQRIENVILKNNEHGHHGHYGHHGHHDEHWGHDNYHYHRHDSRSRSRSPSRRF